VFAKVFFLILESLGSTELVFILIMALVFFGPRKLPQLSRSLGKNLASFRRASEDFKRTWDKEVSMEELNFSRIATEPTNPTDDNSIGDNSILDDVQINRPLQPPTIEAVAPERVIPREPGVVPLHTSDTTNPVDHNVPLTKRDWL
jgi:sec-independent protein translocase protein TatB